MLAFCMKFYLVFPCFRGKGKEIVGKVGSEKWSAAVLPESVSLQKLRVPPGALEQPPELWGLCICSPVASCKGNFEVGGGIKRELG